MENIEEHVNVFNGGCHPIYDRYSPEFLVLNPHVLNTILTDLQTLKEDVSSLKENGVPDNPTDRPNITALIQKDGNKNKYIYSEDPKEDSWTEQMNNFPPVRTAVTPGSRFIQTNGHIYPEWSIWGGNGVFFNDDGTLKSESICRFKDISTYSRFPIATESADGVMSASDKKKFNSNQNDIVNFKLIHGAKFKIFLDGDENPFELNDSDLFELRRSSNDNKLYIHSINDSQGSTSVLISERDSTYWFNMIEKNGYYCLYNESNNKFCAFKKDNKAFGLFTKTSNNTFDKMFSNTLISTYISRFKIELVNEDYTLLQ